MVESRDEQGAATDEALAACIERLAEGDCTAREELILRAWNRLTRLTRKMLRDNPRLRRWEQTDDVLQNALLRLYRALEQAPPTNVVEFFRLSATQIRRELIDIARHYYGPQGSGSHHSTLPPATSENQDLRQFPANESPAEHDNLLLWSDFHEQIGRLGDEEREVFELLWYQELPQAKAAQLLKIPQRTLERRWQAARLSLQSALDGRLPR